MTTLNAARLRTAALTAVGTTVYYAVPDLIDRRPARAAAKTAIVAGLAAVSFDDFRRTRTEEESEGIEVLREQLGRRTPQERLVLGGLAAATAGVSTAFLVAAEKWLYRRGERRVAEGNRWGHLRGAVVLGALAGALALAPPGTTAGPAEGA
ncbi:hypothetical protein C8046_09440 [Serinibacter arcticus]|uniref:Peptidase S9 n=1 Tax=Serinibacter arcticus TaxID=1655435 RepID=A0A2U1ZV40_9MICO|nr:hypothetical protein [Serinibacter arcticus]PWD50839.1 hypothetical protein C8046_09440 [Serinibacter arcticus]